MRNLISFIKILTILFIVGTLLFIIVSCICGRSNSETAIYELSEITEGTYAIVDNVVSSIPAQNYTMVTICCNNTIKTYKGQVQIIYNNINTKAEIKTYPHLVNADEVKLYVPEGTVEYRGIVGTGGRR